jgi:hypothetical protein
MDFTAADIISAVGTEQTSRPGLMMSSVDAPALQGVN